MKNLTFRTATKAGRKPCRGRLPELIQTGPKGFFVRRCPWTGYFYAKGGRDSKSNGKWGRAIRGMKWNCYLREGLKPLKDFRSDIMFFINLSVAWKLIKRWKSKGEDRPEMPLLEGIRESAHNHHPNLRKEDRRGCQTERGHREEKVEREASSKPEPRGRPRAEERVRACGEEEPYPVLRLPPKRILPEPFTGPSMPEKHPISHTDRTPELPEARAPERAPRKDRSPGKKRGKSEAGQTIKVSKAHVPGIAPVRIAEPRRAGSRKRPERVSRKCGRPRSHMGQARQPARKSVAARKRPAASAARALGLQQAPIGSAPAQIMLPGYVYCRQHRPTVSSAKKKVMQLKVARADDPNQPR